MGDALLVRGVERIANLHGVLQCLIERQRPLQRSALDVLHHQVIRPDIVQRDKFGMIQRRHGASFALESFAELGLGNLDRDDAIQARVARLPHLAHATRADRRKNLVRAEFVAGRERHMEDAISLSDQEADYSRMTAYPEATSPDPISRSRLGSLGSPALRLWKALDLFRSLSVFDPAAARSSARAPARMPIRPILPSWQAYS